jgi:hypothetical protein
LIATVALLVAASALIFLRVLLSGSALVLLGASTLIRLGAALVLLRGCALGVDALWPYIEITAIVESKMSLRMVRMILPFSCQIVPLNGV